MSVPRALTISEIENIIIEACYIATYSVAVGVRLSTNGIKKVLSDGDPVPLYSFIVNKPDRFNILIQKINF